MVLRLQRYDLQVEYEPGKNLLIVDTPSRAPEESTETAANTKDEFDVLTFENVPVIRSVRENWNSVRMIQEKT